MKLEGFFASNSKYVVCFNKFFAGKDGSFLALFNSESDEGLTCFSVNKK